jgi:protein-L-isoaspartate(D-aspartate) O-methyltransferase
MERDRMVDDQIEARGVTNRVVLEAMRRVPRHAFVRPGDVVEAYDDHPLSIGHGQTISQPYIVGIMSELLDVGPGARVLEVGSGSGYQSAVLAEMGCEVFSIEIVEELADHARTTLAKLGYDRVHVKHGDGYHGWPEHAPFDGIIVTAAPPAIPEPLEQQLRVGGRLVVPVGDRDQILMVLTRTPDGFERKNVIAVRFVPMTGEARGESTEPN